MKKISRIVSVMLIICMCSWCVYAEDTIITNDQDQDVIEENVVEQIKPISELKFDKSEVDEATNEMSLFFSWSIDESATGVKGIVASLYSDVNFDPEFKVQEIELEASQDQVYFEKLDKNLTYYLSVTPYNEDENGEKVLGESLNSVGTLKPEITSLEVEGTFVTVTYNAVEGASKYIISYDTNGEEAIVETTQTSYDIYGLKQNSDYSFKVMASFELNDDGETCSSEWSDAKSIVTGTTVLKAPSLGLAAYNKGAILSWAKVPEATSYEVWRYYGSKWSKITTVTGTSYKNTGLKVKKKYTYKVRAIRNTDEGTVYSQYSNTKEITAKEYLTGDIKHGYRTGKLKKGAKKYKAGSSTKVASKSLLKRGTKVTIIDRCKIGGHNMSHVKLSNGKTYWIRSGNISFNAPYTTKDYTTEGKEAFVNKKGYSSKTDYLLFISCYTQKVYVFKGSKGNWDLQKTFKCCTGKASTRTPRGTYKIHKKSAKGWCYKYVTYFAGKNSFHTRPYGSKTMGKPASNGCIRLYDNDAKYIYKSIPKNTTVVSY